MKHIFDIRVATQFGVDIAVVMQIFNQCNLPIKKNSEEIRWIAMDEQEFYQYFNYWPPNKIQSLLKKCVSLGLLLPHPEDHFCYACMSVPGESK